MNKIKNVHYKIHKPEPLELIQRYNLSFVEGNVVKYVLRRPFKGDSTGDLDKALSYAQLLQDIGFYRQFEASELNEYTELNAIEKEIVCDVIRSDVTCVVQKLQKAISIRGMENVAKALTERFAGKKESIYLECPSCKDTLLGNVETEGLTTTITFEAVEKTEKQKEDKPFEPDWLPPHPLYTLLEIVDEDPHKFMEMLEEKCNEEFGRGGDPKISAGCISLAEVLAPEDYLLKALSELGCGSEEFWKNRYSHYWEKRKKSVTK